MKSLTPKTPFSKTAFASAVLMQAMADAAEQTAGAEMQDRINAWVATAKARYLERVEGIPEPDAEECATTAFRLTCMVGKPGKYIVTPHASWPDPVQAADDDMARWGAQAAGDATP